MAKVSSFQGLNSRVKSRQTLTIGAFRGVDLSSPAFNVDTSRAIDMKNLIRKDRVLEKRDGFVNIANLGDKKINNIWFFNNKYVVNASGDLVILDNLNTKEPFKTYEGAMKDMSVNAFFRNKKLWILGGIAFLVLNNDFSLQKVEEIAEVPTTTIGIAPNNLTIVSDSNRTSYDAFNNLTYFHKNELTSGLTQNGLVDVSLSPEYELDSDVILKDDEDINKIGLEINSSNLIESVAKGEVESLEALFCDSTGKITGDFADKTEDVLSNKGTTYIRLKINPHGARIDPDYLYFCKYESPVNKNFEVKDLAFIKTPIYETGKTTIVQDGENGDYEIMVELDNPEFQFIPIRVPNLETNAHYKEAIYKIQYGDAETPLLRIYNLGFNGLLPFIDNLPKLDMTGVYRHDNTGMNVVQIKLGVDLENPVGEFDVNVYEFETSGDTSKGYLPEYSLDYKLTYTGVATISNNNTDFSYQFPSKKKVFSYGGRIYDPYVLEDNSVILIRRLLK